jgi:hypothetical protein
MESMRGKTRGRRGCRIVRRLPLMLHWREPRGAWRELPAETRMLSRRGCLVACSARIKYSDEVMVWWMEKMRYSQAHVVFRSVSSGGDDAVEMALEFDDCDDFWGMDFSRGTAPQRPHEDPALQLL